MVRELTIRRRGQPFKQDRQWITSSGRKSSPLDSDKRFLLHTDRILLSHASLGFIDIPFGSQQNAKMNRVFLHPRWAILSFLNFVKGGQ
jgi:hypothetical protein